MALGNSATTKVLITGAAGGMGRACARLFGATHDLILTDVAAAPLERFAAELCADGYTVLGAHAGDLGDAALLAALTGHFAGAAFALIHTAGLSPALADWDAILRVNLIGTHRLLDAVEPHLVPGCVGVLIASNSGYLAPAVPDLDALLKAPLAPGFLEAIGPRIETMAAGGMAGGASAIAYMLSKRAMLSLTERKALEWGPRGGRIVSISPGLILTPMGRKEMSDTPGAKEMDEATPVGRSGTAMDIALTAQFLASDAAGFISGSDVRVDGGSTAIINMMMGRI